MATALANKSALSTAACSRVATRAVSVARPSLVATPRPLVRAAPKVAAKRDAIVAKALPMEVAQLAEEGGFIGGVALTMVAITLLGLAVGFVLLRVEGLVEEGKL
eukprot:GHRR01000244.1.p3 GENE.GHRR01000244.1~~GHRR01000244.1.p3  ORF type:complete len:105 (+),score=26.29 GHRR01000244.1:152-466(+)